MTLFDKLFGKAPETDPPESRLPAERQAVVEYLVDERSIPGLHEITIVVVKGPATAIVPECVGQGLAGEVRIERDHGGSRGTDRQVGEQLGIGHCHCGRSGCGLRRSLSRMPSRRATPSSNSSSR